VKDFITAIGTYLKNIKPFSPEAFILLSVFSWLMSLLVVTPWVRDFLSWLGWLFLTVGVGWLLSTVKQKIWGIEIFYGYWITGAIASAFVYQLTHDISLAIVNWPPLSALLTTIPKFLKHGTPLVDPRVVEAKKYAGDRQQIILVLLCNLILSCWLQFHFLIQHWLMEYPSLVGDSFRRSAFVVQWVPDSPYPNPSRGIVLLNLAETVVREELEPSSWSEVERWLLDVNDHLPEVTTEIAKRISPVEEDNLWQLRATVLPGNPDYTLRLWASWQGPSSRPGGYFAQKFCSITQAPNRTAAVPRNTVTSGTARVICQPSVDHIWFQSESTTTK